MRKGGEAPLAGGAAGTSRASGVGWRGPCCGVGGTIPAPAFPHGETGKGIKFLAAAGDFDFAATLWPPIMLCSSIAPSSRRARAGERSAHACGSSIIPESAGIIHIGRASIRTLIGVKGPWVHVGIRFKAQVRHYGDGPGLLGAAI